MPAAEATRADSAGDSSAAASFNTAARGSDIGAREHFPTPRPQDGTRYFSIALALSAAVATHADSAGTYCTAAIFYAAVRGSKTAARDVFSVPRPQDGTLYFGIAPALPAAVATGDGTTVRGGDAFTRPSSTGDVPKPTNLQLVQIQTGTTSFLSRHLLGMMHALQALAALAEWRAMPLSPLDELLKHTLRLLLPLLLR